MNENGRIEVIVEKGKAKRPDLKYYPNWSWKITERTKEWEERHLVETTKREENQVIITPKWSDILTAIKDTIKHELIVDNAIPTRTPDLRRYMRFLNKLDKVTKEFETDLKMFSNIPEIYTNAYKQKGDECGENKNR